MTARVNQHGRIDFFNNGWPCDPVATLQLIAIVDFTRQGLLGLEKVDLAAIFPGAATIEATFLNYAELGASDGAGGPKRGTFHNFSRLV